MNLPICHNDEHPFIYRGAPCPYCDRDRLLEIIIILRGRIDTVSNLCDLHSSTSDVVSIADIRKALYEEKA